MRPSHQDIPWIDQRLDAGFWDDRENRVAYMRWLGQKLSYSKTEDWYKIKTSDFKNNHGDNLLSRYYRTRLNALEDFIPDHDWKAWLFSGRVSHNF